MDKKEWFEEWFDSPYYHLLYNNRDESEAASFVNQLVSNLNLKNASYVLDLGCGKGRHAIELAKRGFEVTGLDISGQSIQYARKYESELLSFYVHDMRKAFRYQYYNAIFSLFTSFGYFKTMKENITVVQHIYNGLKANGIFVLDYLNKTKVVNNLVLSEKIKKGDITFNIKRELRDGSIKKHISFPEDGIVQHFTESVSAFSLNDIEEILVSVGFSIQQIAGNYALDEYNEQESDRLIIIAQKPTK